VSEAAERVEAVRGRIRAAAQRAGRDPDEVTLVAVAKTHPPEAVQAVVAAGVRDVGENRTEELAAKQPRVTDVRWHHVGRLQTRAANEVVGRDVLLHGVDRRKLVDRIERLAAGLGVVQRVLVQVNVGDDPAKGGCDLSEVEDLVTYAAAQQHVDVEGLMTVPPLPEEGSDPNAAARPHFATLRELRDRLGLHHLSMGMSADLEAAVEEGATLVRVGTDIFGPRGPGPWTGPPGPLA